MLTEKSKSNEDLLNEFEQRQEKFNEILNEMEMYREDLDAARLLILELHSFKLKWYYIPIIFIIIITFC